MSYTLIPGSYGWVLLINGKKYYGVTDAECFERAQQDDEEE